MCSFQPEPSGDDPNWLIFFKGVVEKPPTSFSTWILQGYVYFCLPCHLHWCFFSLLVPQGRFIQLNRPGREQCVGFTLRSPLHFARGSFTTIHTHCKHNIDYIYLLYYICHVYLSPVKTKRFTKQNLGRFFQARLGSSTVARSRIEHLCLNSGHWEKWWCEVGPYRTQYKCMVITPPFSGYFTPVTHLQIPLHLQVAGAHLVGLGYIDGYD